MKLAWVHYPIGTDSGKTRGYLNVSFSLWNALRTRLGSDLIETNAGGAHPRLHLHVCPPHFFRPVPGKVNVLFTMWETETLPPQLVAAMTHADRIIVPSEYCRQVWRAHGLAADVVPLGVHDAWLQADTSRGLLRHDDRVLRFLWVGSSATRKGWELLAPAWKLAFGELARGAQLYVKVIAGPGIPQKVEETHGGRVVVDSRDLELVDLLHLYESADVFVFPSYGEGFGLPVLEAMAAGCLAVSTGVGGLSEFVNPVSAIMIDRSLRTNVVYGGSYTYDTLIPSAEDVARAMRAAHDHWGTPKVEDRRTYGTRQARRFTWNASVDRLLALLRPANPAGLALAGSVVPPSEAGREDPGQRGLNAQNGRVVSLEATP